MKQLKNWNVFFLFLLLTSGRLCADAFDDWTSLYNPLLTKYVVEGKKRGIVSTLVKYNDLRNDSQFRQVIYGLARLPSFETLSSKDDQLAMWINAYNVLILKVVTENPDITSIKELGSAFSSIWKKKVGVVAGKKYALDEIEHEIIRARFQEPRAHFALVCASLSCPDLANFAYQGIHLNEQLDHQTHRFLSNKTKGMMISSFKEKVYLSKIFKWYKEDFQPSVKDWLMKNGYLTAEEKSYSLSYMKYDWSLNSAN